MALLPLEPAPGASASAAGATLDDPAVALTATVAAATAPAARNWRRDAVGAALDCIGREFYRSGERPQATELRFPLPGEGPPPRRCLSLSCSPAAAQASCPCPDA